jgi:predicted GH43/DUF377 family glycosyl hydrolase
MKLKRFEGNPILSPNPAADWESLVACNPGAYYDPDKKEVLMLYRASGREPGLKIHFGLAVSKDGYHFKRMSDQPVFSPSSDGFDAGCVEDARIIKMGDWFYVTYASRPYPPGPYWLPHDEHHRVYKPWEWPAEFPSIYRKNETSTCLAMTQDFRTWIRAGRITDPMVDDRDVILFPEKIDGRFYMLHRPMGWVGEQYGTEHPAMWISSATDLLCWENPKLLAKAQFPWENQKIGGNTPPIKTKHGWLILYHAVGTDRKYRLGAMLLALHDPSIVRYRTHDWIFQPEEEWELTGPYPHGVCFPCGKVVINDTLFVYYGGGDKYVGLATCKLNDLMDYLLSCPVIDGLKPERRVEASLSV